MDEKPEKPKRRQRGWGHKPATLASTNFARGLNRWGVRPGTDGGARMPPIRDSLGRDASRQGRPPKGYVIDPRRIQGMRDAARARIAAKLDRAVEVLEDVLEGRIDPELAGPVLRSIENFLDRGGVARKTEVEVEADLPTTLYAVGWKDMNGECHDIAPGPDVDSGEPGPGSTD